MNLQKDKHTASKPLFLAVLISGVFLIPAAWDTNFDILIEDVRQSYLATDPGFSHISNPSAAITELPDIVDLKIKGLASQPEIDTVFIDINPEDYRVLLDDRKRAIDNNVLVDPAEIKAKLRFNGDQMKANVRLKGDMSDHWLSKNRMSLRIELKNDASVLGFNEFSLQKASARQHPYDSLFQTLMRRTGNLASVHRYVKVVFNGKPWGTMIMEEAMTSEYLEKLGRKESLIAKFSNEDKGVIEEYMVADEVPVYNDYRLSDDRLFLKIYEENKNVSNPAFRKWYSHIARSRAARSEIEDGLYDIDAYGRAIVFTAVWNEAHPLWHANSRHYFNPYTLKLEPITTDGAIPYSMRLFEMLFPRRVEYPVTNTPLETNSIYNSIISTAQFQENSAQYYDAVATALVTAQEEYDNHHSYFPLDIYQSNFAIVLVDNAQFLQNEEFRTRLFTPRPLKINDNPQPPTVEQRAYLADHVHFRHFDDGRVEIRNLLPDTVHLDRLILDGVVEFEIDQDLPPYAPGSYEPLTLQTDFTGLLDSRLAVETRYADQAKVTRARLSLVTEDMHNPLRMNTEPGRMTFLEHSEGQWSFSRGDWVIDQPLVLDGDLDIPAGTTLCFADDAYLIVKGTLTAGGQQDAPISFDACNTSWKGIYVLNATGESRWRHVKVSNYSALEDGLLSLTGGITFYKSDVVMDNVTLSGVQGEDALNLVQSSYELNALRITNTVSDALDSDFSRGEINNPVLSQINGDALDFSGSTVTIRNVQASDIYDKVVSVGEASTIDLEGGVFSRIGAAVVSKDGSMTTARELDISDYVVAGAMSYQKKSFYDDASLVLEAVSVDGESPFIRQTGSLLTVDEDAVAEQDIDVDYLYESTVMKK